MRDFNFTYYDPRNSDSQVPELIPISTTIADLPLNNNDFGSWVCRRGVVHVYCQKC